MTSRRLIRIKVLQLLYAKHKKETVTIEETERELLKSMEKSTDLYYETLLLITELRRKAFLKIDTARNRRFASEADLHPNTRFLENPVFDIIEKKQEIRQLHQQQPHHLAGIAGNRAIFLQQTDGMAQIPAIHEQAFRDV